MKRYLEAQPRVMSSDGKLWLVAHYNGARSGRVGGVNWSGGVANQGAPLTTTQLLSVRGGRVCWWPWEPGAKVEFEEGKQPRAYVDDPDPEPEPEKKKAGRPKKDA